MRVLSIFQNLFVGIKNGDILSLLCVIGFIMVAMVVLTVIVNVSVERKRRKNPPPEHTQYRFKRD